MSKAKCYCCDKLVDYKPLSEVENLASKLMPGQETPIGECVECGALTYPADRHRRISDAFGVLQRDYWDDVEGTVESLQDMVENGEIETMDDLHNQMHQTVDGDRRVFVTSQAILALLFSPNDEAYEEEFGGNLPNWSQLAYCAYYRDVSDHLFEEVRECESCHRTLVVDTDECAECSEEVYD